MEKRLVINVEAINQCNNLLEKLQLVMADNMTVSDITGCVIRPGLREVKTALEEAGLI